MFFNKKITTFSCLNMCNVAHVRQTLVKKFKCKVKEQIWEKIKDSINVRKEERAEGKWHKKS
jgi:hypothetical protein